MDNNKVYVSWNEVQHYINNAISDIRNKKLHPCGVYGIPRGGTILATLLSYNLNIPLLQAPYEGCIIVDDIADSGRSLIHYTNNDTQFNTYYITTMYYHERSMVKPQYYEAIKTDQWIEFPWEHQMLH